MPQMTKYEATVRETRFRVLQVGERLFGIPESRIVEVSGPRAISPIPFAPPQIAGLVRREGHLLPAFDLRACLGPSDGSLARPDGLNVIIRREEDLVSFLVDGAEDVVSLRADATSRSLPGEDLARGGLAVVDQGDRPLHILCVDRVIDSVLEGLGG